MDILQVALVLLILVLGIMLSVLGLQVFLILRDLRKSLDKIDLILGNTQKVVEEVKKPLHAAAEVTQAVESGVKVGVAVAKKLAQKPSKRLFKRR